MGSRIKPNFLIVGAAKAGTTSLVNYLNQHPEIFIPKQKELRFFVSEIIKNTNPKDPLLKGILKQSILDESEYFKTFNSNYKLNGEASVHYLYHYDKAIPKIHYYLGDIPIIIILRNPVKRAISNWAFNSADLLSFAESFFKENERKKLNFNCFWYYKSLGLYYEQVKAYIDNFSKVKIVRFNDFVQNTEYEIRQILKFLSVDSNYSINTETIHNKVQEIRSEHIAINFLLRQKRLYKFAKFLNKKIPNNIIQNKDKQLIDSSRFKKYFKPDIEKTNKLISSFNIDNIKL